MVEERFIEKLTQVSGALEESKGALSLFAVLKMDDLTDKWTVVASASWVTNISFDEAFTEVRAKLVEVLQDEMSTIARIGIFNPTDHFAQLLINKYHSGDSIKEDTQINGNLIHEGYIIKIVSPS
jgi:hypothetical protein